MMQIVLSFRATIGFKNMKILIIMTYNHNQPCDTGF
jgi:hypothetical protein